LLILGIDPGSLHTGYGLVEKCGSSIRLVDAGRISCPRAQALPARLAALVSGLVAILDRHPPDLAALEKPFHGQNAHSLIVLAQARGALLATLAGRGIEIAEYSPAEVKMAVTGSGRADKGQVAWMVGLLIAGRPAGSSAGGAARPPLSRVDAVRLGLPLDGAARPGRSPGDAMRPGRQAGGAVRPGGPDGAVLPGLPADATDALALALCCAQRLRFDRLGAAARPPRSPRSSG
jgi:crossover junction endodeoxyribonuclease RuvC